MKLLLDTHAFLWHYFGEKELSQNAKNSIEAQENSCFISHASLWEISIKWSLGKLELNAPSFEAFCKDVLLKKYEILPLKLEHFQRNARLKFHHGDPFDRILIAHALVEDMAIVTKDPMFAPYSTEENFKIIW